MHIKFQYIGLMMVSTFLLSACRTVVYEGDGPVDQGMDEGVRQIMMEEEYQYPEQEEGMIYAPSEEMKVY